MFLRAGDDVYRTHHLQHGPLVSQVGGQVEGEDVPDGWPQSPTSYWMRRHDQFHEPAPVARHLRADGGA